MSDFVYVLITLVSFAALAVLVGLIDRRLSESEDAPDLGSPGGARASAHDLESVGR